MADTTYQPGIYRKQGGNELVITSGGVLTDDRFGEAGSRAATVDADELVIPITARYVAKTTGGDAEALSLADGTPGQVLTVSLVTDGGGTGTLAPTTCSGFVSIAFADAGDTATLEFIDSTTGWVILGTAGVSGPPAIALS